MIEPSLLSRDTLVNWASTPAMAGTSATGWSGAGESSDDISCSDLTLTRTVKTLLIAVILCRQCQVPSVESGGISSVGLSLKG